MRRSIRSAVVLLGVAAACRADRGNLIFNGSFEEGRAARRSRRLDDVRQSIRASAAHGRRRPRWRPWGPARLHRVQRRRTQLPCHGLSGRQGRRAPGPAVQADVLGEGRKPQGRRSRRRPGQHPRLGGLRVWETFTPGPRWERFEFLFQCQHDVPAATSRLQVWFKSTGTLWLDDVTLAETSDKPQWYPRIGTEGVTNAIPNSSFQCGTIGWGSLTFAWAAGRGTCSDSRVSTRRATQDTVARVSRSPSMQPRRRWGEQSGRS